MKIDSRLITYGTPAALAAAGQYFGKRQSMVVLGGALGAALNLPLETVSQYGLDSSKWPAYISLKRSSCRIFTDAVHGALSGLLASLMVEKYAKSASRQKAALYVAVLMVLYIVAFDLDNVIC